MIKYKHTQNTEIKNIMKYLIGLIFVSLLGSCGTNSETQTEIDNNTSDLIILTEEQMDLGKIELGQIKKEAFPEIVNTNGIFGVPPERKATVSAYFAGYVKKVNILEGQKVEKGQVLFTLENPDYIKIQQDFLVKKAKLKNLESEYKRQEVLYKENVSSQKSFLTAETNYLTTEAEFQSLRQQLKMMHLDPDNLTAKNIKTIIDVISPMSGYLTDIRISNGIFLPPSYIALTIVNTDHLHLELSVYEKKLHNIREGQEVRFSLLDKKDKEYKAVIIQVGKSIDPEKRTISVHSHLENDSLISLFTVGMYVDAKIYISSDSLFALPNEAIVEVDGISYALLLDYYDNENVTYGFKTIKLKTGKKSEYFTEILNHNDFDNDVDFITTGAFNLIKE